MKTKLSTQLKAKITRAKSFKKNIERNNSYDPAVSEYLEGRINGLEQALELVEKKEAEGSTLVFI